MLRTTILRLPLPFLYLSLPYTICWQTAPADKKDAVGSGVMSVSGETLSVGGGGGMANINQSGGGDHEDDVAATRWAHSSWASVRQQVTFEMGS